MSYITTITGKHFDPIEPERSLIDIYDIAHSLSHVCRANGHMKHFYSVAQHSMACAREAAERGYDKAVVLGCLLHDGSEAYMSDVIRPLKSMMSYYLEAEDRLQNMIWEKFIGHIPDEHERELIFEIDDQMLSLEFKELMAEALNDEYKKLKCAVDTSYRPQADIRAEFIRLFEEVSKDA